MPNTFFSMQISDTPLIAIAVHHGHELRSELRSLIRLDEATRLREEDPLTGTWTLCAPNRIVVYRSRFEVDLNRPRPRAVYASPEDAWGLEVWHRQLPEEVIRRSLEQYDLFYQMLDSLLSRFVAMYGRVVVFDLHSYNHRRNGEHLPPASVCENPEINVGTGTMDRHFWAPVVDTFIGNLRAFQLQGHLLDVRENIRFRGGAMAEWIHQRYPKTVCALAIEVKKTFMDEWTGNHDPVVLRSIREALASTTTGVLQALQDVGR
jgi:N-formylglutamate deformylase